MQEMVIYGVSFDMVGKQPIVLLKTVDGNKFLPIWIGHPEAAAILMKLQGAYDAAAHDARPYLARCWRSSRRVVRMAVTELRENTFYAPITLARTGARSRSTRARATRFALAVRTDAPIFAADKVIEESAIEFEHEVEDDGGDRREVQGVPRRRHARGLFSAET